MSEINPSKQFKDSFKKWKKANKIKNKKTGIKGGIFLNSGSPLVPYKTKKGDK